MRYRVSAVQPAVKSQSGPLIVDRLSVTPTMEIEAIPVTYRASALGDNRTKGWGRTLIAPRKDLVRAF
jgi:hypothetical protein